MMPMIAPIVTNAQTTNLNARFYLRPLTTGEISTNKLPSTVSTSGGQSNVAIGTAAYLEVDVAAGYPTSDLAGVVWTLTMKPAGSQAFIGDSPIVGLPVFEPSDRLIYQVAGRAMIRPDVTGVYEVSGVVTTHSGKTATVAGTILGATYVGLSGCAKCHNGGTGAPVMVPNWQQTLHSQIFTQGITGQLGSYSTTCLTCHTVGFDANATVDNGGFSKTMAKLGWTFPTSLQQSNWDNMPSQLQNLGNIQCENCHGAGSEHANNGGTPWAITKPQGTGACQKCHDAPTHHIKGTEWNSSMHAVTTTDPAGNASCVGCHTGTGFKARMSGVTPKDLTYHPIDCGTCHEPHGMTTPASDMHIIRAMAPVKLADGTVVSNAGEGALCMNCHQSRQNAAAYVPATAGSSHYGPHYGTQGDMIEGVNGYTYGQQMPTSAHGFVAKDTCVACHLQTVNPTDPGFLAVGGHTFKLSVTPAGSSAPIQLVAACQGCHGSDVTTFDFPLFDYNNDGKIEGVQTEVQHLMDQLSSMLPPVGQPKTSLSIDATWTKPQLAAAYNWTFVHNDGSKGVHNTAYTVALLKASIADLGKQ